MAHDHIMYDADPHFRIDPDTRVISYESPDKLVIIQNDHNSEIATFDIPKTIDGHDMTLCNKVQVHYINIDANNKSTRVSGVYDITDLQVSEDNPETAVFSWLISKNATSLVGTLHFVVRFACVEGSRVTYAWHTSVYTGINISQSIDNSEPIVEEYIDVLQEWYYELIAAGTTGVNVVAEATDEAIARIARNGGVIVSDTEPTLTDIKLWIKPLDPDGYNLWVRNPNTGEFAPIVSVMASTGETINIVQGTGESLTDVMSQNAVSETFKMLKHDIGFQPTALSGDTQFTFELFSSGTGYVLTGIQEYYDYYIPDHLVIPETYNGLPVVAISTTFNSGVGTVFGPTSIVVPSTVKYIAKPDGGPDTNNAFSTIWNLKVLNLLALDRLPRLDTSGGNLAEGSPDCKIYVKRSAYEAATAGDNYVPGWDVIPVEMMNKIVVVDD